MNILMMTNTYRPFIGGVERSVEMFSAEYRLHGHRVVVVTPEHEGMPQHEEDVFRIPALQNFNGSDFSVKLPAPGGLSSFLDDFSPDIVHSHHPFLIGDTALRIASTRRIPLVYTFHTFYEQYTHYVPGDSPALKRFVSKLTQGYADLCDYVLAPSDSAAHHLRTNGVGVPIAVIPTGIYVEHFARTAGIDMRKKRGISRRDFVVGLVSRIAPEKNIEFLSRAVALFLLREPRAHFLVAGAGPAWGVMQRIFAEQQLENRVHMLGTLEGDLLISAYQAMDVFSFASHSETQGIVLAEAMACGVPVVAVDAPGVREILTHNHNGLSIEKDDPELFAAALEQIRDMPGGQRRRMRASARAAANLFSIHESVDQVLAIYRELVSRAGGVQSPRDSSIWEDAVQRIKTEWDLFVNMSKATKAALREMVGDQT